MKTRNWRAYFRLNKRTYAFVGTLMERWGSTGHKDPNAPDSVSEWWDEWHGVGTALIHNITPRSLLRRSRQLDAKAHLLPRGRFPPSAESITAAPQMAAS